MHQVHSHFLGITRYLLIVHDCFDGEFACDNFDFLWCISALAHEEIA